MKNFAILGLLLVIGYQYMNPSTDKHFVSLTENYSQLISDYNELEDIKNDWYDTGIKHMIKKSEFNSCLDSLEGKTGKAAEEGMLKCINIIR